MEKKLIITGDNIQISDTYHTFDELYTHRIVLFIALLKSHPQLGWKSRKHNDGTSYDDYFIAGMELPTGDITYHIMNKFWDALPEIKEMELGKPWDGHSSEDVLIRLSKWIGV